MNLIEQLKRDGHLLTKSAPPKKTKKRLNLVGAKRKQENAIYKAMLPGWIKAHPTCEIGPVFHAAGIMVKCKVRTTHPHHVRGRHGKLLYDERYMKASCSGECHPMAVHQTHVKEARELGLLQ